VTFTALAEGPRWFEVLRCSCKRRTILVERYGNIYVVYHGQNHYAHREGEPMYAYCDACKRRWDAPFAPAVDAPAVP
jgi:hypothetical protein